MLKSHNSARKERLGVPENEFKTWRHAGCKCFSPSPDPFVVKVGPDWPEAGRIESGCSLANLLSYEQGGAAASER